MASSPPNSSTSWSIASLMRYGSSDCSWRRDWLAAPSVVTSATSQSTLSTDGPQFVREGDGALANTGRRVLQEYVRTRRSTRGPRARPAARVLSAPPVPQGDRKYNAVDRGEDGRCRRVAARKAWSQRRPSTAWARGDCCCTPSRRRCAAAWRPSTIGTARRRRARPGSSAQSSAWRTRRRGVAHPLVSGLRRSSPTPRRRCGACCRRRSRRRRSTTRCTSGCIEIKIGSRFNPLVSPSYSALSRSSVSRVSFSTIERISRSPCAIAPSGIGHQRGSGSASEKSPDARTSPSAAANSVNAVTSKRSFSTTRRKAPPKASSTPSVV